MRLDYTDDGELVPSALLRDFELTDSDGDYDEYEEGCREMSLFDRGALESCLQKFSYANQFVNQIIEKVGGDTGDADAVIILFNYNASVAEGKEAGSNGTRMNSFKR